MNTERKKRKRRKTDWSMVVIPFFAAVALISMISCFLTMGYYHLKEKKAEEALASAPVTYTQEEVDLLVEHAVQEAVDEAVQETNDDFLAQIRTRMENGESTVSMLRDFYPDNLVVYDKGKYVFLDILDSITHNNLSAENIRSDEETGEITYVSGEEVISHKGIDVSKFQGEIDWKSVKNDGVEYAFIRLGIRGYTSGEIVLDESFEENVTGALEEDMHVGVYFFSQAVTEEEILEEADFVIENLEPYEIDYPVVIDIEEINSNNARTNDLTAEERTQLVITFCERIKEAGYTPMIYGNLKTFLLMLDITQLEEYEKWYAYYSTEEFYYPYDFSVWQYTESGSVDGIDTDVDINISFKEW